MEERTGNRQAVEQEIREQANKSQKAQEITPIIEFLQIEGEKV